MIHIDIVGSFIGLGLLLSFVWYLVIFGKVETKKKRS